MTALFIRLHLFLARHRKVVVAAVVLFGIAALLLGRKLRLNEDYTDMLPMSDPAIASQVEALKHIKQAERLFFDVQTISGEPEGLAQAADQMYERLLGIPELTEIRYSIEGTDAREVFEELQAQLPVLLASNDLHELEARLDPAAVERRLSWFKKTLGQPQGLMLQTFAQADPVGLGDSAMTRLRALQAGVGDARIVAGRITSADGKHVLITAQPKSRSSEIGKSKKLIAKVLTAVREVEGQFPKDAVRIAVTGAHRVALDNATMIQQDSTFTSVLATVAVAALMLAAYRRRWLSLLGLVPTVFGALGSAVIFYLIGEPVSAVALGCGSILIGVTVDYGIYLLYHADDSPPGSRERLARVVWQLAPTLAFGALTTMAAFLIMFASPVSGHRQLGAFGAIGVALAAAFAIVILPLFIPSSSVPSARVLPLTAAMQRLFNWRDRHARIVLPLLGALSLLCGIGVLQLRFDGDLSRFNGMTAGTRRDEQAIRETWGKALSLTTIVVSRSNKEEALLDNEKLYSILQDLQQKQVIESFSSIAPLLPSERSKEVRSEDWRTFWTEARRTGLSNSLAEISAKMGIRVNAFTPFLNRLGPEVRPEAMRSGTESALSRLLGEYCREEPGRYSVSTLAKAKDGQAYRALREAVLAQVPGALLLNKSALGEEIARVARRGLPMFAIMVIALNAVLLFLFLGRLELVGITLLPMLAGVFWTLGSLGLMGIPIDMSNFIFVIFVIGVGGDYSLFFLVSELEPLRGYTARMASTAGAVTICALTTLFGVGVLVLARHPALFSMGLTALLGISLSLLATLFLVPLCIDRFCRQMVVRAGVDIAGCSVPQVKREKYIRRLYRFQEPYVAQFVRWKLRIDPLFKALDHSVPESGKVLDLGCGFGIVANWLTISSPQRTVFGLDNDGDKIRVARVTSNYNPRVRFEKGDVLDGQYPACDCVLMCDLLHYLPHEVKLRVLQNAYEALRPGGVLVVRDAFQENTCNHRLTALSERWGVRLGQNKTAFGLHFESMEQHQSMLQRAGFCEVDVRQGTGLGSNRLLVARKPLSSYAGEDRLNASLGSSAS